MEVVFYISAAVAVLATIMVVTEVHAVHALLYLIVSLLSVSLVFFTLGAPFVAALEVTIYAGAIMVLFVFVIMMLNVAAPGVAQERGWLGSRVEVGVAGVLAVALLAELVYLLTLGGLNPQGGGPIEPRQVGALLFGPYLIGVELVAMLLLAGLVGAYHLGRRDRPSEHGVGGGA